MKIAKQGVELCFDIFLSILGKHRTIGLTCFFTGLDEPW
jgi:hypothetical protein